MRTNMNATCLHLAVQNGNIELVEYILTEFTNEEINQLAEPLGTPLHIAGNKDDNKYQTELVLL
jgi:ankyrin repeat protein